MLNTLIRLLILATFLVGCAHHGALRVECEGPLRPINPPMSLKDAPVTVVPASPDTQRNGERQP
jgi:hypothetical protein